LSQQGLSSLPVHCEIQPIQLDINGQIITARSELSGTPSQLDASDDDFKNTHHNADLNSAYIMYTSGSTGEPKGIIGTHSATLNRLEWMWSQFPFTNKDVCVNKTALSFVDSIWELFGPLLKGVPTYIFSEQDVLDIFRFVDELERHRITRLVIVPSLLSVLLDSDKNIGNRLKHLNQIIVRCCWINING